MSKGTRYMSDPICVACGQVVEGFWDSVRSAYWYQYCGGNYWHPLHSACYYRGSYPCKGKCNDSNRILPVFTDGYKYVSKK